MFLEYIMYVCMIPYIRCYFHIKLQLNVTFKYSNRWWNAQRALAEYFEMLVLHECCIDCISSWTVDSRWHCSQCRTNWQLKSQARLPIFEQVQIYSRITWWAQALRACCMLWHGSEWESSQIIRTNVNDKFIAESSSNAKLLILTFPHSEMMEICASKTATDERNPSLSVIPSQIDSQIAVAQQISLKTEPQPTAIKNKIPQLVLSADEILFILAMRIPPTTTTTSSPSTPGIKDEIKTA